MFKLFKGLLVLTSLLIGLTSLAAAAPPQQEPPLALAAGQAGGLTTPQLIETALTSGEIDHETAYLYLAYALGDYQNLPTRYRSNVPWDGTLPLFKLQEAVKTMKVSPKRTKIIEILSCVARNK